MISDSTITDHAVSNIAARKFMKTQEASVYPR